MIIYPKVKYVLNINDRKDNQMSIIDKTYTITDWFNDWNSLGKKKERDKYYDDLLKKKVKKYKEYKEKYGEDFKVGILFSSTLLSFYLHFYEKKKRHLAIVFSANILKREFNSILHTISLNYSYFQLKEILIIAYVKNQDDDNFLHKLMMKNELYKEFLNNENPINYTYKIKILFNIIFQNNKERLEFIKTLSSSAIDESLLDTAEIMNQYIGDSIILKENRFSFKKLINYKNEFDLLLFELFDEDMEDESYKKNIIKLLELYTELEIYQYEQFHFEYYTEEKERELKELKSYLNVKK